MLEVTINVETPATVKRTSSEMMESADEPSPAVAQSPPAPFSQSQTPMRVLTVGDGDLSLSLAMARAYGDRIHLTASTLQSKEDLIRTYSSKDDAAVLQELEHKRIDIRYGWDATQLHKLAMGANPNPTNAIVDTNANGSKWNLITFHHPHLGLQTLQESEVEHVRRHHVLLCHYLASARQVVVPANDTNKDDTTTDDDNDAIALIHVCLCGAQPETWQLLQAAQRQRLRLIRQISTRVPFHAIWTDTQDWVQPPRPGDAAPRRYRNGKLGSRHFLGKYGYKHRRTEGAQHSGSSADMNVAGSAHFVFEVMAAKNERRNPDGNSNGDTQSAEANGVFRCEICNEAFDSASALQRHQAAPALPIYNASQSANAESMESAAAVGSSSSSEQALPLHAQTRSTKHETPISSSAIQSTRQPIAITTTTATTTATHVTTATTNSNDDYNMNVNETQPPTQRLVVAQEHAGKRLKWYLKNFASGHPKSKMESLIKGGNVMLNDAVVVDSGRFLAANDCIAYALPHAAQPPAKVQQFKIIERLSQHDTLIVWKDRGVRTKGFFNKDGAAATLEAMVSQHEKQRYESISKLDTCCPGLCALLKDVSVNGMRVCHILTMLVHGRAPWTQPTTVELTIQRQWKRSNASKLDTGSQAINDAQQAITEPVTFTCLERMQDASNPQQLSTIQVEVHHHPSTSSIGTYLRQHGHPIVGDHLSRNEYLKLKRSIRNRIKNKLSIGCYQLTTTTTTTTASGTAGSEERRQHQQKIPEKLSALHWERHAIDA